MTNSSGSVVWQQSFDPYGQPTNLVSTTSADFGYAGMYNHGRSTLSLTLFRTYNPALGRWISRDPLGESIGTNLYYYGLNEPIRHLDPLGLDVVFLHDPRALGGIGRSAVAVGSDAKGWTYESLQSFNLATHNFLRAST